MILTNELIYPAKTEVNYNEQGQGQPMILLHGLFGSLSNWSSTINFFSDSYRVITPVLPIYDSSWKPDVLNELVQYVHALVKELNLNDVILVGNSLGGHVATLYTLAYPELVKHLVLTGSSGLFESSLGVSYPRKGDYNYIAEKVRHTFYDQQGVSEELINEVFTTVNDVKKTLGILKLAKAANRNNISEDLRTITTPTLLIWGKDDRVTPVDVAWQFKEKLAGKVELHIIGACGHAPMMEQPEAFNYILNNYLKYNSESFCLQDTSEELKIV